MRFSAGIYASRRAQTLAELQISTPWLELYHKLQQAPGEIS